MLIGYILMGFIVYIVMVALGEMGAWLPHKKSFSGYASRFVDPALGYVWLRSNSDGLWSHDPSADKNPLTVLQPDGITSSNTSSSCQTI